VETEAFYQLKRQATAYSIRRGFPELADDFVSFLMEMSLKTQTKPYMNHAFIDFLRITLGNASQKGHKGYARANARLEPIEYHVDDLVQQPEMVHFIDPKMFTKKAIPQRQRVILILMYQWGFSQREVSHVLGLTEGCISAELKRSLESLKNSQQDDASL
jgi:hypothetical protein